MTLAEKQINLDLDPFMPDGLEIESHKKDVPIDLSRIGLYLDPEQKDIGIKGIKLRMLLEHKLTLNACALDYLLAHTEIIPKDWRFNEDGDAQFIYFFGTVYRDSSGASFIRCLYWHGMWGCSFNWLGNNWDKRSPAALRVA